MIPLFLEHVDAEERRFIRSAPQNAILSHAAQGSQTQGFQNHIPARGRKLACHVIEHCDKQFQNHIPARGRKPMRTVSSTFGKKYFKTTSPQGDGNSSSCAVRAPRSYFKTTSPQGDGNMLPLEVRKRHYQSFQNHIPARGRKHVGIGCNIAQPLQISKPHPRKGTETALLLTGSNA